MARTLPTTVIQAIYAPTTSVVFLDCVEFTGAALASPLRLVNNTENVTSNGDLFTAFPFSVILPPDSDELPPRAQLIVDNASLDLIDEIRGAAGTTEEISARILRLEAANPNTVLQTVSGLILDSVIYDAQQLTVELAPPSQQQEPFPGDNFTPAFFPGIF